MNSLYITRHTNGSLCLCADTTTKNGKNCVLYLSWNLLHLRLISPDSTALKSLKVGERQVIV